MNAYPIAKTLSFAEYGLQDYADAYGSDGDYEGLGHPVLILQTSLSFFQFASTIHPVTKHGVLQNRL